MSVARWREEKTALEICRRAALLRAAECGKLAGKKGLKPKVSARVVFACALANLAKRMLKAGDNGNWQGYMELSADYPALFEISFPAPLLPRPSADAMDESRTKSIKVAIATGAPPDLAIKATDSGRMGRRPARRELFITAHDLHAVEGRTWRQITDEICDCGNKTHTACCQSAIKSGATRQIRPLVRHWLREIERDIGAVE